MRTCNCGCGESVAGKANYRPGHDARHAGMVGREAVAAFERGQGHWDSKEFYTELPSPALRDKALNVARKIAEKTGPVDQSRRRDVEKQYGTGLGQVKVGRWTYPARELENGTFERNTQRDGNGEWVKVHPSAFMAAS